MVDLPGEGIEIARDLPEVSEVGLESGRPLSRRIPDQQLAQPGHPYVGVGASFGHLRSLGTRLPLR